MPPQARYNICTITTKDISILSRREAVKKFSFTDEDIYLAGIEKLEEELNKKV